MFRTLLFVLALSLVACGREEPTGPGPGAPVAALPDWAKVSDAQRAAAREAQVPVAFENSIGMRFVLIPAGTFRMGSPETENGRDDNETLHEVVVSRPFYLGVTEVTNGEFRRFRSSHDSWSHLGDRLQGERQPVVGVVWDDAMAFTKWLTDLGDGRTYRLPTEAEWEYACRAGTATAYWWGASIPAGQANYDARSAPGAPAEGTSRQGTVMVGTLPANPWGLYEVHGNVRELCTDRYGEYPKERVTDPTGPVSTGTPLPGAQVMRGGSWRDDAPLLRAAARIGGTPHVLDIVGFRVAVPVAR